MLNDPQLSQQISVIQSFNQKVTCGQSYKASTLVNYDSRVVSISNLLVIRTLES